MAKSIRAEITWETSAKTGEHVEEAFMNLIDKLIERKGKDGTSKAPGSPVVRVGESRAAKSNKESNGGCC